MRQIHRYDGEKIYRADLLPVPSYLTRCLTAFANLGEESLNNFLDQARFPLISAALSRLFSVVSALLG